MTVHGIVDQSIGANELVYDPVTDALFSFVKSSGVELGDGDDSSVQYDCLVLCN